MVYFSELTDIVCFVQCSFQHPSINSLVNSSSKKVENYWGLDLYSLTMQPGAIKYLTIEAPSSVKPLIEGVAGLTLIGALCTVL